MKAAVSLYKHWFLLQTLLFALSFAAPSLDVTVVPVTVTVLDIAPYNNCTLTCIATLPTSVGLAKTVEWRETTSGVMESLNPDNNAVDITTSYLDNATSMSLMSLRLDTPGQRTFTCVASLQVPGDSLILQSDMVQVTIKGEVTIILLGRPHAFKCSFHVA